MATVKRKHIPNWMRLAWIRKGPEEFTRIHYMYDSRKPVTGWECAMGMERMIGGYPAWDHFGSTVIDGKTCFVSEPYCTEDMAIKAFAPLAELLGCKMTVNRESEWGHGTIRVVLHPPE